MEQIATRYSNFKQFVITIAEAAKVNSFYLELFSSIPLDTFLKTVHARSTKMSQDEMITKILELTGIKTDVLTPENVDRFKSYLDYFNQISRLLYQE